MILFIHPTISRTWLRPCLSENEIEEPALGGWLFCVAISYVGLYRNMQNLVDLHALGLLRQVLEEIVF